MSGNQKIDMAERLKELLKADVGTMYELMEDIEGHMSLPANWTAPLMDAIFNRRNDLDKRLFFMGLLAQLPAGLVTAEIHKRLDISYDALHDYRMFGDTMSLDADVDRQLPSYGDWPVVEKAVEKFVMGEVHQQSEADLFFQGIDEGALDWINDPDAIPDAYDIKGKCASCSHFHPRETAEGGVLGECDVRTATLGLFRQDASCDEWVERR